MKNNAIKNDRKKHEPKENPNAKKIPQIFSHLFCGDDDDEIAHDWDKPRWI